MEAFVKNVQDSKDLFITGSLTTDTITDGQTSMTNHQLFIQINDLGGQDYSSNWGPAFTLKA